MSQLNDHEFGAFEAELRRYRPRAVDPLPLSLPFRSPAWIWMGAAAAALVIAIALWFFPHHRQRHHHIAANSEPLTQIHAQAALARGANVDDLAPLPIVQEQPHGISALEVLSQE